MKRRIPPCQWRVSIMRPMMATIGMRSVVKRALENFSKWNENLTYLKIPSRGNVLPLAIHRVNTMSRLSIYDEGRLRCLILVLSSCLFLCHKLGGENILKPSSILYSTFAFIGISVLHVFCTYFAHDFSKQKQSFWITTIRNTLE